MNCRWAVALGLIKKAETFIVQVRTIFIMPFLAFNLNDGNEFIFDLFEDRLTLGRNARNEIVIDNTYISSFHAILVRQSDSSYEVSDLQSVNGTFINGERIDRGILKIGDHICFGQLNARLWESKTTGSGSESKITATDPEDNNRVSKSGGIVSSKLMTTNRVVHSAAPASSSVASELAKLRAEIERQQLEFNDLEARHAAKENSVADLIEQCATQQDLMQVLSKQRTELEDCIKKLQSLEEQSNQKLVDLDLRRSELQAATATKSTLLENLTTRHDALQVSISELTREETALRGSIADQTELAKSLEQILAPSREALQQTESALAEARAALENLSQIHADDAAARASLQEAITRREEEEARAAQLATNNAKTQKLLDETQSQLALLQEQQADQELFRQNLNDQIADHQARHETATAATGAAELMLAGLQADIESSESMMNAQIVELTCRVDVLRREEDGMAASLQASRERLQKNEAAFQELDRKLADKELAYSQFTRNGERLVSLSEALSQMESREQEVSRHISEVAEQELSTQVKLNSLDEEIARGQLRLDQIRRKREDEEQLHRERIKKCEGELDDAQQHLADQWKQEESTLALRLKERIQELEEKHELLRQNLSASMDEKTVIVFAGDLIKRIDLVDILIQRFSGSGTNAALEQQLHALRASLEDVLAKHGISEFTVAPGAEVNVDLRLRITIVESIPGARRPKVVESYRPGFIYTAENGREVILRKVEVKTSSE